MSLTTCTRKRIKTIMDDPTSSAWVQGLQELIETPHQFGVSPEMVPGRTIRGPALVKPLFLTLGFHLD